MWAALANSLSHNNISPGIPTAGHQQQELPGLCFGESGTKLNTHPAELEQGQETRENYSGRSGPGARTGSSWLSQARTKNTEGS